MRFAALIFQTKLDGKGYFEDRRPASNMDPYTVTAKIVQTTVLDALAVLHASSLASALALPAGATV